MNLLPRLSNQNILQNSLAPPFTFQRWITGGAFWLQLLSACRQLVPQCRDGYIPQATACGFFNVNCIRYRCRRTDLQQSRA